MTLHAVYWLLAALWAYVAVGLGMALHALDRILKRLDRITGKTPPEVEQHHRQPIYVVAQYFEQAVYYARNRGLLKKDWRYVSSIESLLGLRNATVVFTGTWYERKDATDLWEHANLGGLDVVEESA